MSQTDCLLCHVVSGTLRARRVAESDGAIAIMNDAEPFSRGHIGARVASHAGPDEVLVSSTVKDLVAGSGLNFPDRGAYALKGLPGDRRLFAVEESSAR